MSLISLKTQKIMMFIPVVNISIWFIWWHNYKKSALTLMHSAMAFAIAVGSLLPFFLLYRMLSGFIPSAERLFFYLYMYIAPLLMGFGLIQLQKRTVFAQE